MRRRGRYLPAGRIVRLGVLLALVLVCAMPAQVLLPLPDSALRLAHGGVVYDGWPDVAARPGTPQKGLPAGFVDEKLIDGLVRPTAIRFLPDGRVLVAEQRGMLKLYPAADRDEPRVLLDLRSEVLQRSQIGLLGLAVDPDFPSQPYIYLAYSRDAPLGGAAPTYGVSQEDVDECPQGQECPSGARLVRYRLDAATGDVVGDAQVLVDDWCLTGEGHTIGTLAFGPDGALFAGAGDGAGGNEIDYGQLSSPPSTCGDPPSESGSLRSQDLGTLEDPVGLDGTIVRIDRATGARCRTIRLSRRLTRMRVASSPTACATRFASRCGPARTSCGSPTWAGTRMRRSTGSWPVRRRPIWAGRATRVPPGSRTSTSSTSRRARTCMRERPSVTFPAFSFARGPDCGRSLRERGCGDEWYHLL